MVVAVTVSGSKLPEEEVKRNNRRVTFRGDKMTTGPDHEVAYVIDPTKTPKHIDVKEKTGTVCGLYSLDGDTLTLLMPDPFLGAVTSTRPAKLEPKAGDRCVLAVFRREKP